ncbi:polysaccharide biosynthesis protein [Thioclava sp. 15-R06ZXC-3]|uniref:Polysaccharide biosynthesis protein n=1 Tax=Thioclava arctica TaxID=3238301 RepID=A0ABV3TPP1_9RHOB
MLLKRFMGLTRKQKDLFLLAVDVALVPIVGLMSALLLLEYNRTIFELGPRYLPILMIVAGGLSMMLGLHRVQLKHFDAEAITRALIMSIGLTMMSGLLEVVSSQRLRPIAPTLFGMLYFLSYIVLRRGMLQLLTMLYRRSRIVSRVIIYGAGFSGIKLSREMMDRPDVMVYGFIDDSPALRGSHVNGLTVYPVFKAEELRVLYNINRVILADPDLPADRKTALSRQFEALGITTETLPAFAQLIDDSTLASRLEPVKSGQLLGRDDLFETLSSSYIAYAGSTVLVSGAGGSIGLELCRQVIACRPAQLILLELSELALYAANQELRLLAEPFGTRIVPVLGSAADPVLVASLFAQNGVDAVMHAAAYKHVPLVEENMRAGLQNNVFSTQVLARAAREAGVARFVLVSSDKAVRPGSVMGASKRLSELVVQDLADRPEGTIFSIVRFGNVLGSSGSVVPLFEEQILRGGPVTLTDLRVTRYFMTIQEAARLVLLAGSFADGGEVYVLDMGKPMLIRDLARRMIEGRGFQVRDRANPDGDIEIVTTGLRPGEKLYEELMVRKGAGSTSHPKIIRVREDRLSELQTAAMLRDLRDAIERNDPAEMLATLARAIPEYMPQSHAAESLQMSVVQERSAVNRPANRPGE